MQPDLREDGKFILVGPEGLGGGLLQHRKTLEVAEMGAGLEERPHAVTIQWVEGKFPSKLLSFLFSVTLSFLCFCRNTVVLVCSLMKHGTRVNKVLVVFWGSCLKE